MRFAARFLLWVSAFAGAPVFAAAEPPLTLTIYVYDSFFSGSAREQLTARLKAGVRLPVEWIVVGDSGQLTSRYRMDQRRGKPRAHLLIGVDQSTFGSLAGDALPITEAEVPALAKVDRRFRFDARFLPLNRGTLALMVDTDKLPEVAWPKTWSDLLRPELRKKLILEDPRTSTPGLGFLLGSYRALGAKNFRGFWRALKSQWLTLAPGWSQAYGLFQKGQAPLVWSYTTSQAYHQLDTPPTSRYRALTFGDGNPEQVEGAIVPKDAPGGVAARKATLQALEILLGETTQAEIPRAQWMFPVRTGAVLPWLTVSPRIPDAKPLLDLRFSAAEQARILKEWSQIVR